MSAGQAGPEAVERTAACCRDQSDFAHVDRTMRAYTVSRDPPDASSQRFCPSRAFLFAHSSTNSARRSPRGDLLDPASVQAAMKDVKRAYFTYPVADGLLEAVSIFAATARDAGLELVVNNSPFQGTSDNPAFRDLRYAASFRNLQHRLADGYGTRRAQLTPQSDMWSPCLGPSSAHQLLRRRQYEVLWRCTLPPAQGGLWGVAPSRRNLAGLADQIRRPRTYFT
jgi:hypothetical protein